MRGHNRRELDRSHNLLKRNRGRGGYPRHLELVESHLQAGRHGQDTLDLLGAQHRRQLLWFLEVPHLGCQIVATQRPGLAIDLATSRAELHNVID
jgi:hypothetical protein